jgi:VIT1/CCC1 family predicted Fe2+/Mn2+ transporter
LKRSLFDQLDPEEMLAEVVAGLVMVLTFTLVAGWLARGGDGGPKAFVMAAIGCNVAWGAIDAVLYLLGRKTLRSYRRRFLRRVQLAKDEDAAQAAVRHEWEPILSEVTREEDRERLYSAMRQLALNARPPSAELRRDDFEGALAIFVLVCATAAPAILPFLIFPNDWLTLRISNFLLIALLFEAGRRWGKVIDESPSATGVRLVALGLALVGLASALGG